MSDTVVVETKPWYQSLTLWTNAIGFLIAVLSLTEFMAIVPQSWAPYIAFILAVLNIALRYFSIQPIGVGAEQAKKGP